jgi:hypothetical protein
MRVALGIVVGAVIVLMGLTSVVHGLGIMGSSGMIGSSGMSDNFYSANDGLNDFKMKMAQIISNAPGINSSEVSTEAGQAKVGTIQNSMQNFMQNSTNNSTRNSSRNSSYDNSSLDNRTSDIQQAGNSTLNTGSSSGGSMLSQTSSTSPSGLHFDNQASFNGIWSLQASKQGFGNSGINDRMALSGDFDVKKSISFKG